MKKIPLLVLLFLCAAGMPQPKTLTVTWDPYLVQPGFSNVVICVYKSTSLGTVFTPPKPTAYFPASRTNGNIVVLGGQLYHFYCTAQSGSVESDPSNICTNQIPP